MRATPRLLAVTVPDDTPVNLYDLLHAIDTDIEDHVQALQLEVDTDAMAALVYVGNSDLDIATDVWGIKLQAGQVYPMPSLSSNLVLLKQIYLATDGTDVLVGCVLITR